MAATLDDMKRKKTSTLSNGVICKQIVPEINYWTFSH